MSKQKTNVNDPFKLARHITAKYLEESSQRFDAAERAAMARRLIERDGSVTLATLELYFSDPAYSFAAEFLEGGDHSWTAMIALMDKKHEENGGPECK